MIRRFFKDIWAVIKNTRHIWRLQRILSREEIKFNKMTEKYGPIHTFLVHFEEIMMYQDDYYLEQLLEGFVEVIPSLQDEFDNIKDEDIGTVISYCKKYEIDTSKIKI